MLLTPVSEIGTIRRLMSVDPKELDKFSKYASEWFKLDGKFKILHKINNLRSTFINDKILESIGKDVPQISILDVGCGGGILSDTLYAQGYSVTGIDPSEPNILAAKSHNPQIQYLCTSIEEFCANNNKFDVVIAMEVIEHVECLLSFIKSASKLLKTGGLLFISTLNRTLLSFLHGIIFAEYVLGWVPKGTHNWKKFITPYEISSCLLHNNIETKEFLGIKFNPVLQKWYLDKSLSVNYILCGIKNEAHSS